jgi:hypothetical protein
METIEGADDYKVEQDRETWSSIVRENEQQSFDRAVEYSD